jgi:transcriptional regulator with GAF, ATPase, and Fis domain
VVDVRFVCATHRDLAGEVAAGRFRADLRARLERWVIRIPPLRERPEDIPLLALALGRRHRGDDVEIARDVALSLLSRDWPGNVRELDAWMERAVVAAKGACCALPPLP